MNNPRQKKIEAALAANDLAGAEKLCRAAIQHDRYDFHTIALLGAIQLQGGRLEPAERNLKRAISLAPTFAKPHHDLGVLYMNRNEPARAEAMFRKTLEIDRHMKPGFLGLLDAMARQGKFAEVKDICTRLLERNPDDPEIMRSMAIVHMQENRLTEAQSLFERILGMNPGSVRALMDLARCHAAQQNYPRLIELLERAIELQPGNAHYRFMLADNLFITGDPGQALEAYEAGLEIDPDSARGRTGRSNALRALGRTDEAVSAYRASIAEGINVGETWWSLASLRTHRFSDEDIEAMRQHRHAGGEGERLFVEFALGKAMDDREEFNTAWKHYKSANKLRRRQIDYDPERFRAAVDTVIAAIGPEQVSAAPTDVALEATPIFIVGMPRSGSTLVEQVLASHSQVEATTELPYLVSLGENVLRGGPDAATRFSDPAVLQKIREAYMDAARFHRKDGAPFFIDKMPDNYLFAGLIAMALPGAKIIDVRRNPMDTCVGNYRQWFGIGKEYSYDLSDLGKRYVQYARIMDHWEKVAPGAVLRVDYEAVVEDLEREARRIVDACGLSWEEGLLRYHESDRAVTTASSEQVRQPVYTGAVGFWKNYEPHLAGLAETLKPVTA